MSAMMSDAGAADLIHKVPLRPCVEIGSLHGVARLVGLLRSARLLSHVVEPGVRSLYPLV